MWYKLANNDIVVLPPYDGAGHMTCDDPALIFEATVNGQRAGYALLIIPKNKNYSFIGQVTVRPEYRLKGVATQIYQNIDRYLETNNLPSLKPCHDLSPGSKRIWEKRLSSR